MTLTQYICAICCRPSVCRLSATFVRPTQPVETFGNVSMPFDSWYLCHPLTFTENFTAIVPGEPLRRETIGSVKRKTGTKYSDFGPIEGYISETVQDMRLNS